MQLVIPDGMNVIETGLLYKNSATSDVSELEIGKENVVRKIKQITSITYMRQ